MARNIQALEAETGTELCRVKVEGGSLGGYRSEMLTENLSEREGAMYKCPRCDGIMKDASFNNKGGKLCDCCKMEGEVVFPNVDMRTTIVSLKCGCPLSKRGCEWLGRLENVSEHLTTCGQVFKSCQLSCSVVSTRDEMGKHLLEECSQREEECLHCSGVHKVCGKVSVLCELGCGTRVCRDGILCHRESECSEETVVCPYGKYRCEVVAFKRRELKRHLEESWRIHTELKLNAIEQQTELKLNAIEQQMELKFKAVVEKNESLEEEVKSLKLDSKIKDKEIKFLKELLVRAEGTVTWNIKNILAYFKSNLGYREPHCFYVVGYPFLLHHSTDDLNFIIYFSPNPYNISVRLEWPFQAIFITRVISHRDTKDALIYKSPLIVIQGKDYRVSTKKQIASFPLSTNLKDFINSGSLELEMTVRILKNN